MDAEDAERNRSLDVALLPVRLARRPVLRRLKLHLPPGEEEVFDSEEESQEVGERCEDLPCFFMAYGNGKARKTNRCGRSVSGRLPAPAPAATARRGAPLRL